MSPKTDLFLLRDLFQVWCVSTMRLNADWSPAPILLNCLVDHRSMTWYLPLPSPSTIFDMASNKFLIFTSVMSEQLLLT